MTTVDEFKSILESRRNELLGRLERIEDQLDEPVAPDFEDAATEHEDDEVLEAQGNQAQSELASIEAALSRIENGRFGICLSCGEPISQERLLAVPFATKCRNCMEGERKGAGG